MEPQATPQAGNETNPAGGTPPGTSEQPVVVEGGGEGGTGIAKAGEAPEGTPDLSAYFRDGEAGVFDAEKVAELARKADNSEKSKRFWQSEFMKKNNVPETADGYGASFKPDSAYEKFMDSDVVKDALKEIREFALNEKLDPRSVNALTDYYLKSLVSGGVLDNRTPEQIAAAQKAAYDEEIKLVEPMLQNLNRSKEDNDIIIEKFLAADSVFTKNPEMVKYIRNIADDGAMGYMFATMLCEAIEHRGVPLVSGTISQKDEAALTAALAKEDNPEIREKMMKEFYGEK